jgi:hypothetical protein
MDSQARDDPTPPARPAGSRPLLVAAACFSAAAGLVHAAAAGAHRGAGTVPTLFAAVAIAQVAWAGAVVARPVAAVLVAGAVGNGAAVGAWVVSRTVGLPWPDELTGKEPVGTQDLTAALAGGAAVACALLALAFAGRAAGSVRRGLVPALAVAAAVVLAVPGMAAEHEHDDPHEHDPQVAAATAAGADGHDRQESSAGAHDEAAAAPAPGAGGGHDHGPIPDRLDHDPTPGQLEDAKRLIDETKRALVKYADVDAAIAAGYVSIGDGRRVGGYEHFVNAAHVQDPAVLDPETVESLVYEVLPGGGRRLATAMYILPPGSTMDDVPDVAGNLTVWHDHQNLCFAPGTFRLAGVLVDGKCTPGGELRPTSPMLHVWVVDNPCGPFAGTDNRQFTGSCVESF